LFDPRPPLKLTVKSFLLRTVGSAQSSHATNLIADQTALKFAIMKWSDNVLAHISLFLHRAQ
jgi:hypothetical protein